MDIIMEHLGVALLAIVAVGGTLTIIFSLIQPSGVLHNVILNHMSSICG